MQAVGNQYKDTQAMSDNLDKELTDWINTKPTVDVSKAFDRERNKTTVPMAALRGLASGVSSGLWPNIAAAGETAFGTMGDFSKSKAESEAAQEKAWQDQPGAYGTAYTGGTVAGLAMGPGIVAKAGTLAAKGIAKAAPLIEKGLVKVAETAGVPGARTAMDLSQGLAEGAAQATQAAKDAGQFDKISQFLNQSRNVKGVPLGAIKDMPVRGTQLGTAAVNAWDSSNAERIGGGFAEGGEVVIDEDEKRRQAMAMQSTVQGRQQTNTDY